MTTRIARTVVILAILVILVVTLWPAEPTGAIDLEQVLCIFCSRASLADALSNLALFLPLGVAFGGLGVPRRRTVLFAAGLSLAVELAQFAIPGRDPSLSDVIFNVVGAWLGRAVARAGPPLVRPPTRLASRLSLLAAMVAGAVFILTDVLLRPSLPEATYLGGSADVYVSAKPLRLGGNTESRGHFEGRIDDVRVYSRERSAAEIASDMRTPVTAAARSPELVAAYNFDEGSGSVLTDVSGHGNAGRIQGAAWTDGRFAGALAFNGVSDVVVIPASPSLELVRAMTLEAWIYPTAGQRGRRAVLEKEYDDYFLLAGSRDGALRPGGGATFGASTERLVAPAMVPTHAWTHVAMTYDGAVAQLYLNGELVARRLRWYPGRVTSVMLDGLAIPAGVSAESPQLRARLLAGAPLTVRAVAASPVATRAPLVTLHDEARHEILLLAAEGHDIVVRLRSRAAAAELDAPVVRAAGLLHGVSPGDPLIVTAWRSAGRYCVGVNGRTACGLGFTVGMGWSLFVYSQIPPGWLHPTMNALWVATLVFPFGFWLRRRWESALGGVLLTAGAVLPCTLGTLSVSSTEIVGALLGLAAALTCSIVAVAPRARLAVTAQDRG